MAGRLAILIQLLLMPVVVLAAELEIPDAKRIESAVVQRLAAPAEVGVHMPTDVAVDSKGRVFLADGANDRILLFSADGKYTGVFPPNAAKDAYRRPVGVTVDAKDQVWVTDTRRHRVLVFSSAGEEIERIDLPPNEEGHAFDPTDVAITRDGKRSYIVDNDNHRIVIRNNATGVLTSMGRSGRGLGQFQWPFMLAITADQYVYVTEAIGARLQRISPTDRWAGQVGRWGVELGQLYRPKGVAVDGKSRLYVSDSTLGVVQVFDSRGSFVGILTDGAGAVLRFEHPMGMCFDKQGQLYVVELRADRVAVISLPAGFGVPGSESAERGSTGGAE